MDWRDRRILPLLVNSYRFEAGLSFGVSKPKIHCCLKEGIKDMEERELLCENCRRQVPSENYQMHVMHCKRNIQPCSLCGEAVLRSEEREHFDEYHAEIYCVQCGQKTTRSEEGNHLANECGKRPIPCQYCEISLPREKNARASGILRIEDGILPQVQPIHLDQRSSESREIKRWKPCEPEYPLALQILRISDPSWKTWCSSTPVFSGKPKFTDTCSCRGRRWCVSRRRSGKRKQRQQRKCANRRKNAWSYLLKPSLAWQRRSASRRQQHCCPSLWNLGELCPSDRLMEHQDECREESESTVEPSASGTEEQRYESDLPHFRFSRRPYWEWDESFDNFTTEGSPYDILANVFRDLEERRWPFEMMRDLWSRTWVKIYLNTCVIKFFIKQHLIQVSSLW